MDKHEGLPVGFYSDVETKGARRKRKMTPRDLELKYKAIRDELRETAYLDTIDQEKGREWRCVVGPKRRVASVKLTWKEAVAWCKAYNDTTRNYGDKTYFHARMEREKVCRCPHCKKVIRQEVAA